MATFLYIYRLFGDLLDGAGQKGKICSQTGISAKNITTSAVNNNNNKPVVID